MIKNRTQKVNGNVFVAICVIGTNYYKHRHGVLHLCTDRRIPSLSRWSVGGGVPVLCRSWLVLAARHVSAESTTVRGVSAGAGAGAGLGEEPRMCSAAVTSRGSMARLVSGTISTASAARHENAPYNKAWMYILC